MFLTEGAGRQYHRLGTREGRISELVRYIKLRASIYIDAMSQGFCVAGGGLKIGGHLPRNVEEKREGVTA